MSKASVLQLVAQVIKAINENINKLERPANEKKIREAFDEPIKTAFAHVKSQYAINSEERAANRKMLYKKLSLKLHPDRLKSSSEDYAKFLCGLPPNEAALSQIPQSIIESYKYDNSIAVIFNNMKKDRGLTTTKLIYEMMKQSAPIYNEYLRYPEPIRSMLNYARLIIFIGLGLGSILTTTYFSGLLLPELFAIDLVVWKFNRIKVGLLNLITQNRYDDIFMKNLSREQMANFSRDQLLLEHHIDADEEEDEAAITLYIEKCTWGGRFGSSAVNALDQCQVMETPAHIEKFIQQQRVKARNDSQKLGEDELKDKLKNCIYGREHLSIAFHALVDEIMKPLPGGWKNNSISVLVRLVQSVLMLPWLIIDAGAELIGIISTAIVLSALAVAALSCILVILLTNIPLYLYDFINNPVTPRPPTRPVMVTNVSVFKPDRTNTETKIAPLNTPIQTSSAYGSAP